MMSSRFTILSVITVLAVLSSCKKEETTTYEYMDGSLTLSFPEFLHSGDVLKFNVDTLTTLVRSDGDSINIGYYFLDSYDESMDTVRRSDGTVVLKEYCLLVPDSLSTFSLKLTGFSDGHYNTTASQEYKVIREGLNGNASITNFEIAPGDKTFTDLRDSATYYYTTVSGVDWMRQNLAWKGAGKPYKNADAMSSIFGRFYTQTEALSSCPEGWTLPSEADWVELAKALGCNAAAGETFPDISGKLMEKVKFNGVTMWEYWPDVKIDNAARFSAIPTGYAVNEKGSYSFRDYGRYAMYWSSDIVNSRASYRFLYEDKTGVFFGLIDPDGIAMNVRCVRK